MAVNGVLLAGGAGCPGGVGIAGEVGVFTIMIGGSVNGNCIDTGAGGEVGGGGGGGGGDVGAEASVAVGNALLGRATRAQMYPYWYPGANDGKGVGAGACESPGVTHGHGAVGAEARGCSVPGTTGYPTDPATTCRTAPMTMAMRIGDRQ